MPSVVASALGADQNDAAALYFDLLKKVLTGFLYDESAWLLLEPATKAKTPYAIIKKAVLKLLAKRKLHLVKWRPFEL